MAMAAAMLLAGQVRAEWAGTALALLIRGALSKKMRNVALVGVGIAILLAIGFMSRHQYPGGAGTRGQYIVP